MCRIASQKICTSLNTNICTTSLNCAANCCYNNVCRIGTYCGIAAEGYSCTSNEQCISTCCQNKICQGSKTTNNCQTNDIDSSVNRNIIFEIVLGVVDLAILVVIIVLICVLRNRYRWIETYNKELAYPGKLFPDNETIEKDDSKMGLKSKQVTVPGKTNPFGDEKRTIAKPIIKQNPAPQPRQIINPVQPPPINRDFVPPAQTIPLNSIVINKQITNTSPQQYRPINSINQMGGAQTMIMPRREIQERSNRDDSRIVYNRAPNSLLMSNPPNKSPTRDDTKMTYQQKRDDVFV